ncbi:MAG: transglycosylase SLT domain-containing protein [Woeseiaceae bacterium]|nr:transglycosylase SLT domain-containing protein [Woeseiaceae bacterium]
MTRKCQISLLLTLFAGSAVHASEPFPQPPELQRDVDFWVSIFTEYTTDQGVLHDARNLGVVYESIDFPAGWDRRQRQKRIVQHRKRIQVVLSHLSSGRRDKLDAEEARILALWPDGVSNQTLADASRNIRYQQGLKDRFREGLVRAGRWRAYIEKEFTAHGVPVELTSLPHVESSYNPDARSHVGASGIWQFTRSTGRRFMRVDHVVDERNDPFAATRGAAKLLAYNYSIAGNWPMAITAYNHGLSGVRRAQRRFGDTAYADIFRKYKGRTFGFASRNFYVAFLAAKHVDQNAETYFPGTVVDKPADNTEIKLPDYIKVKDLTAALGITQRQLAKYNPALQATVWQGSKHLPKGFEVRVPRGLLQGDIGDLVSGIAADKWHAEQLPDLFHTIRRGETLSEIAAYYKTRVATLVALNNLRSSHRIRAGQRLRLPAAGPAPAVVPAEMPPAPVVVAAIEPARTEATEEGFTPAAVGDLASSLLGTIQTALLSDPSDYSVADDTSIEIHELETLGHFADWLEIRTQRLRDINGLAFRTPVEVGERIRLDLSKVDAKTFEERRIAWHRELQDSFFRKNVISGVTEHVIKPGESIWILAARRYDVPMWLFRQYNPEVDLHTVRPGTALHFPVLMKMEAS